MAENPRALVSHLDELLAQGEPLAEGFRRVAEINDAFVHGSQFGAVTYKDNQVVVERDKWFDEESGIPRVFVNILGNLVSTVVSLLTKNRPCAINRPLNEDDPESVYQGEVANTLIRYLSQELKTVEVIQKALRLAFTHGSGGIKVWLDPKTKKAALAPVSIFQVTIDPSAETCADAGWFVFHRWVSVAEAKRELAKVERFVSREPKTEEYTTASGVKKRGVKARELWIRPGFDEEYPQGCYAFVVDNIVTEKKPYPLIVETPEGRTESLPPLVWITARTVDECVYGRTAVTDCIPIQRSLNETFAHMLKLLRMSSAPQRIRPASADPNDPQRDGDIEVPVNDAGVMMAKIFGWVAPPPFPPQAMEIRDWAIKQIHDIIGVAPLTAGTETRNVSGKALEEIEGLDAQKNSQTTRSLETAVLDLYRTLLAIVQRFYDDGTKLTIVGGSRAEVLLFNRADIMGADLRLEPASEFDLMQPNQEQALLERANAGLSSPGDVRAAARDPRHAFSRQLAERIVLQVLAGETIDLAPDDVDAEAFKAVIGKHKHIAMLEGRKEDYLTLVEFDRFVDELAAQAADTTAPPPAPSPEPAAPPPAPEGVPQ